MDTGNSEWLWQCNIPERTELQELTLKTGTDIIIGDRCTIDYGLKGDEILISEFCKINGNITTNGDLRLDNWSEINGDIYVNGDAFLGEGVKITGSLVVEGDLDLGDNVQIEEGFEARGWISIRNPLPVVTYILLYLVALLGLEKEEDVSNFFNRLLDENPEEKPLPLVIAPHSILDTDIFSSPAKMTIGRGCRLHGNIRAKSIMVKEECTVFGSLKAEKEIVVMEKSSVHGAVTSTGGDVSLRKDSHILGNVSCNSLVLDEGARLDGVIVAPGGVKIVREK